MPIEIAAPFLLRHVDMLGVLIVGDCVVAEDGLHDLAFGLRHLLSPANSLASGMSSADFACRLSIYAFPPHTLQARPVGPLAPHSLPSGHAGHGKYFILPPSANWI